MSNLQGLKTHSLVARETTGKDFLMPRHFSRSMNNEFDLIFRSCSSLALFCNSTWNNISTIVVFVFVRACLVCHFCLVQLPVQ